jgi:hypothetical protein
LYCGAPLSSELVASATASAAAFLSPERGSARAAPRVLLIVDLGAATAESLAAGLGLTRFEAEQQKRRGGFALDRIVDAGAAEGEATRLRAAGLRVDLVAEAEARAQPWVAEAGGWTDAELHLRGAGRTRRVAGADVLIIVQGAIVREYELPETLRKVRTAGLEPGYRFHLHLRAETEPLELDPGAFAFTAGPPLSGSSRLELGAWVEALGREAPLDDGFRRLSPVMSPVSAEAKGALRAASAFAHQPTGRGGKGGEPRILDNLGQFRFYSAWRGAVERSRLG